MRVTTWNINSVRLRIEHVKEVVEQIKPDVLCMQETKTQDEHFPREAFAEMGYEFLEICGMKSYNGLCIASKYPLTDFQIHERCGQLDCRHISAKVMHPDCDEGVEVHNIYIPAGGDVPDAENNPKFQHKLDFVDEMATWFPEMRDASKPMIVLGDMNIAPLEHDVWSHKQMLKIISHTPVEVEKLLNFQNSLPWVDAMREFVPEEEKLYTWWSYRAKDWKKSNRGRRLDHIWVTECMKPALSGFEAISEIRSSERPSDHIPASIDFDMAKVS